MTRKTFEDLLGSVLGGTPRRTTAARRGADLEAELDLEFDDAVHGLTTEVTLNGLDGSRTFKVRVPGRCGHGQRIRLAGKGGPGSNGGPAGDLYAVVRVAPHPMFGRRGKDLTVDAPIGWPEAVLGTEIQVPTLDGPPVRVRVPAGTPTRAHPQGARPRRTHDERYGRPAGRHPADRAGRHHRRAAGGRRGGRQGLRSRLNGRPAIGTHTRKSCYRSGQEGVRHRRRTRRGAERGTRGPSPGRSSAEPGGPDPRSGSCSEAGSWGRCRRWQRTLAPRRHSAAARRAWFGIPHAQTASYWARRVSQVVGRSRSCCLANMRFNASCPACLLVGDRVKKTSR